MASLKEDFKMKEIPYLTVTLLKQFPGLEKLSKKEAQSILDSLLIFSQLTYTHFLRIQERNQNTTEKQQLKSETAF